MTASSEYVLETLEAELNFFRSALESSTVTGVLVAANAFITTYGAPDIFSHIGSPWALLRDLQGANVYAFVYGAGLALAWASIFALALPQGSPFELRPTRFPPFSELVYKIEREERHRLGQTVVLAVCPDKVQDLIAEIVRVGAIQRLNELLPRYRNSYRHRAYRQSGAALGLYLCLFGYAGWKLEKGSEPPAPPAPTLMAPQL